MDNKTILEYLMKIDILRGLKEDDLKLVSESSIIQTFEEGDYIFRERDKGELLYFIVRGKVKIVQETTGGDKQKILSYLSDGDVFGEMSIITSEPRSASAIANEKTKVLILRKESFLKKLSNNTTLSSNIIRLLCDRLRETNMQIEDLIFKNIPGRIASQLFTLAEKYGITDKNETYIDLKLTHKELAELVGTNRETVSKVLSDFQKENSIKSPGKGKIIITNRNKLLGWL